MVGAVDGLAAVDRVFHGLDGEDGLEDAGEGGGPEEVGPMEATRAGKSIHSPEPIARDAIIIPGPIALRYSLRLGGGGGGSSPER